MKGGPRVRLIVKKPAVRNEEGNGARNASFNFMTASKLIAISSWANTHYRIHPSLLVLVQGKRNIAFDIPISS